MRKRRAGISRNARVCFGLLTAIGLVLGSLLLLWPALGRTTTLGPPSAASLSETPTPIPTPVICTTDNECSDGVFCNGVERCIPGLAGVDFRGCHAAGSRNCRIGQICNEANGTCTTDCGGVMRDADGDGQVAVVCGGIDCDDHDPTRSGGNREFCDLGGHDEDCDPLTYGHRDLDNDGEDDMRCFNRQPNGITHRGTDYDDSNPAIRLGSMVCDGPDAVIISGMKSFACLAGTKCVVQPNKTGVCAFPPPNYIAPEAFSPPLPLERREQLPTLGALLKSEQMLLFGPDFKSTQLNVHAAEVAQCKDILRTGKVPSGNLTSWQSADIDKLCNGTNSAKNTIACFESSVGSMGGAKAIETCK